MVGGGRGFGFGRGLFGEVVLEGLAGFGELVGGELEEGVEEGDFALLGELAGGGLKLGGCGGDLLELEEGESAGVVEGGIPGVELVGFFVVGKGAVEVADLPKEAGAKGEGGCLIGLDAEGFVEGAEGEGAKGNLGTEFDESADSNGLFGAVQAAAVEGHALAKAC